MFAKDVKFELNICNIPQNLAKISPNFISGQKLAHFFSKKAISKMGSYRLPPPLPPYIGVKKYVGTDRVFNKVV